MSAVRRPTKNEKRRNKKKEIPDSKVSESSVAVDTKGSSDLEGIEVEYVSADYDTDSSVDPSFFEQFRSVFGKFTRPEELLSLEQAENESREHADVKEEDVSATRVKDSEETNDESAKALSKKKKKLQSRLSVAELKQLVHRPDVVEAHDVSSSDPRLLVFLKSYRNTVPVPRHWCHIRKYLTGKVGMEKPPFQLPDFIAETGIAKIRDAVMEQEAIKKSKAKARERIRPKMGKIDIDYQVLHDAFFKYQTKPKLTNHGDLYYEGKEFEVLVRQLCAGLHVPFSCVDF
jgi:splicing factor 3B subunit 2